MTMSDYSSVAPRRMKWKEARLWQNREAITPHTKFKGEVYILNKEEGGRHTPFFTGYRPQFYLRTTDVTGVAKLPDGVEMVMPGDNVTLIVELVTPIALETGTPLCYP